MPKKGLMEIPQWVRGVLIMVLVAAVIVIAVNRVFGYNMDILKLVGFPAEIVDVAIGRDVA